MVAAENTKDPPESQAVAPLLGDKSWGDQKRSTNIAFTFIKRLETRVQLNANVHLFLLDVLICNGLLCIN